MNFRLHLRRRAGAYRETILYKERSHGDRAGMDDASTKAEPSGRTTRYLEEMSTHYSLATAASLIAEPSRAAILLALLDGRALAAGELARCAGISAQSASMHLAQLLQSGFVAVAQQGRHRYYRIASAEVAHAVESLGIICSARKLKPIGESDAFRHARTCYDHIAGELGVGLADFLEQRTLIVPSGAREYTITDRGEVFFRRWGIDLVPLRSSRKVLARRCLDWTQRRYHVAGALGDAICRNMVEREWIKRSQGSRVLQVTPAGRAKLAQILSGKRDRSFIRG